MGANTGCVKSIIVVAPTLNTLPIQVSIFTLYFMGMTALIGSMHCMETGQRHHIEGLTKQSQCVMYHGYQFICPPRLFAHKAGFL